MMHFIFLFFLFFTSLFASNSTQTSQISLTPAQKEWIASHPLVKVGGGPDWAPFDFVSTDGVYNGIAKDYLNLISQKTGLQFDIIVDTWHNNLQKIQKGQIDLLPAVYYTNERATFLTYTQPYFEMLDYFFIREDLAVKTIEDLNGKRIAIPKGYAQEVILKKEFPKIQIIYVDTFLEAFDAVLENRADILFDTYAAISYILKKDSINTIIPFKSYRGNEVMKLHMSSSKTDPILAEIIDKALLSITEKQRATIYHKWLLFDQKLDEEKIQLSEEEKLWLRQNEKIVLAGDPNWLPFEGFDNNKNYIGIVADYLEEIKKYVPLEIEPQFTQSWQETLGLAKDEAVDIISGDIGDSNTTKHYKAITPYITAPIVIVMRDNQAYVENLNDVQEKRIAAIKEYGYLERLKKAYPHLHLIETSTVPQALELLSKGRLDAVLLSLPVASYFIKSMGLKNIKIVGKTDTNVEVTMLVHKSKPQLHAILEKVVSQIPRKKYLEIIGEWTEVKFAKKIDYTLLASIVAAFAFIFMGIFYWNRKLSSEIAKRKVIERDLQEREAQVRTLIDNMPLFVLVTDLKGNILTVNPYTMRELGIRDTTKLQNFNITDFYANPDERDAILERLDEEGKIEEKIIRFKRLNGEAYSMMVSILPIVYNHQNTLLSIAIDLTERLEMEQALNVAKEQAEKANLAKTEFLANMSHEIRTPMNAVLGFSELLEKIISDPVQKDYLASIKRGGNALLGIINDILDLSKIEAGKLEIVLESVNLKQLAVEMESIFHVKLVQKNLHFQIQVDDTIPKYLLLDSTRMRQILFNLIGNAIKFTSHGIVSLEIYNAREDVEKSKIDLEIRVRDSGIGIPKEQQKHIFDAFTQQLGQDSQKYGGTGLGLTICKKLTEMMNGSIDVESEVGKGSTFIVKLNDVSISSVEQETQHTVEKYDNIAFEEAVILVVDDIADNRKLVNATLKNLGLRIVEAVNGQDALEKLEQVHVDLILMDIKMPVMNGYEAITQIKNNPKLKQIPVIALTASVMGKDLEKIEQYRFDGYLRKPVSYEGLISEMAKHLPYRQLHIENEANQEDLSQTTLDTLPDIIHSLETDFMDTWEEIKDMGDFSLIQSFAQALGKVGKEHGITLLLNYADELDRNCESFDIDRVEFMMNSYPQLIEKLKKLWQKEN